MTTAQTWQPRPVRMGENVRATKTALPVTVPQGTQDACVGWISTSVHRRHVITMAHVLRMVPQPLHVAVLKGLQVIPGLSK